MSNLRYCGQIFFGLLVFGMFQGCGGGTDTPGTTEVASFAEDFSSSGFIANSNLEVSVVSAVGERSGDAKVFIPEGTEIAVLEKRTLGNGEVIVRLGLDFDEDSDLPSDFWTAERDLRDLEPYAPGDYSEEEDGAGEAIDLGSDGLELARRRGRGMTYCYRYVKMYLLQTGQVRTYLPGSSAYMAARILPRHGFRRTGNSPSSATNGEICVYSGGPRGHGHIEVKRNGKWWYGYGFKSSPISNRRFIGCFKK